MKNCYLSSTKFRLIGLLLLLVPVLFSCKTTRMATTRTEAKPISSGKLIRNMESNMFGYKHLSIKRISCQFNNGKSENTFKASIQAENDKRITVLLSKLNIPLGRLWLTPDSVKFVNFLEDNYFLDDYHYLSSILGMDLDFGMVNAVVSNNIFKLFDPKREKENPDIEVKIDSGFYVLETVKKLNTDWARKKNSAAGRRNQRSKILTDAPVKQQISVDPETFKIRKIKLEDAANQRFLNIDFSEYTPVDKQLYPGAIRFHFKSPENFLELNIRLANFSTEEENEIRFKVPEKFKRINTN